MTPAVHSRFGIWESTDGGVNWKLGARYPTSHGATDLEIDPQNPKILYATFWTDKIYKSTDGGKTWTPFMTGLPDADYAAERRGSRSRSRTRRPAATAALRRLRWADTDGTTPPVYKSTTAAPVDMMPAGTTARGQNDGRRLLRQQCFYDNVIEADPNNPNIVFAAGEFGYDLHPQSGGIFRSDDGGQTWKNLGCDQHPDFHAFAFDPTNARPRGHRQRRRRADSTDLGGRPTARRRSTDHWTELNSRGSRSRSSRASRPTRRRDGAPPLSGAARRTTAPMRSPRATRGST